MYRHLLLFFMFVLAFCSGWLQHEPSDAVFLLKRPWYTKVPDSWTDQYGLVYFGDMEIDGEGMLCWLGVGSDAKHETIIGAYDVNSPQIKIKYIDDGSTDKLDYKITRGHFQDDFDLKLEIGDAESSSSLTSKIGKNGVAVLYSKVDWRYSADTRFDQANFRYRK